MTDNPYMRNPHLPGDDFSFSNPNSFTEGKATGILLVHGFTATTAEVRPLAEKLHPAGFDVVGPLLPGHGTHPDDLNRAAYPMWIEKIKRSYEVLNRQCERVFVIGESMGAVLALELARQHPEIEGLFLFAPAIKIKGLWQTRLFWPFVKYINKSSKADNLPWKGYNVYPVKAAAELHKLQKYIQKKLPTITAPVVIFTGEFDHTIAPMSAQFILNKIGSPVKQRLHMGKSGHCIILDQELDQVADIVLGLINSGMIGELSFEHKGSSSH